MEKHKIWAPIDKVEQEKYLYHYTSFENALKILYHNTLKFSKLSASNDSFERKPKVKLDCKDLKLHQIYSYIHDGLEKIRCNIRILCFSTDADYDKIKSQYVEMNSLFSKDMIRENVLGRGFALPRMWAQYADNNHGVCLVFDKKKIEDCIKKCQINFYGQNVEYKAYYQPIIITENQLDQIIKGINTNPLDFVKQISTSDFNYIVYNYFTKLDDWSSENEFRYITFSDSSIEGDVEISSISSALCGIVIGERMGDVEKYILELLLADGFNELQLKQIVFEDLTTRIKAIPCSSKKKGSAEYV
ncbi:MAG: DUF2971 domain-containing protein [Oscillospiraceae bacterium]|nr:DUF2971 domain-containing protein [Oscillospiraceae bacterium]